MYCHLTPKHRIIIAVYLQENRSLRQIASRIGGSPSTISREIKRNESAEQAYNAHQAQLRANEKKRKARYSKWSPSIWKRVKRDIRQGLTPEQISQRARYEGDFSLSRETIYQHIYNQAKDGDKTYSYLPRIGRKRYARKGASKRQTWEEQKKHRRIELRPAQIQERSHIGHWEADLVIGHAGSGFLVTLVDRKTLFSKVDKIRRASKEEVLKSLTGMFQELPGRLRKSITFDNGKEFCDARAIEKATGTKVYYAHPYHSWERGTNEHFNGLLRRTWSKGKSFSSITERKAVMQEMKWNNIPRKTLNWLTPMEAVCLEQERMQRKENENQGIAETNGLNLSLDYLNIPPYSELQAIVAKRIKRLQV